MVSKVTVVSEQEKAELREQALAYFWQHSVQWNTVKESGGPLIIVGGDGIRFTDIDGNSYIDLTGSLELVNIGYGRHELADVAAEQMKQLHYWGALRGATVPGIKLAAKIASITPGDLNHSFFLCDGSDAVETAIKMARQAQIQAGYPWRYKIISRRNAYHGSTPGAMSLEGPYAPITGSVSRDPYNLPGVRQVHQMECYRCPFHLEYPSCDLFCAEAIEQMIQYENPETVAAVIVDPVPISPRCIVPPPDYMPRLREICDKYGVLLICDEVVDGFGRTGKWFASENWGIVPDIMCLSKGMASGYAPIAATVATDKVFERFLGTQAEAFHHGHTWGGHPVSCAISLRNIEIIERENLVKNSAEVGAYFLDALKSLLRHPIVGDVCGIGLTIGVDLVADKKTRVPLGGVPRVKLTQRLREHGVDTNFNFLTPPLILKRSDVDEIVPLMDEAIGWAVKEFNLG